MTLITAGLRVVAEDTFPLGEISPIEHIRMKGSPALYGSMVLRGCRAPGHGYSQRPLPFQLGFLDLLATLKAYGQNEHDE